ncbi:MAG: hypothetical protein CMO55_15035 [Verrucomicrobiales bacterium]|nr:hypothetical protein [Verrucomicrobiales bacterium]
MESESVREQNPFTKGWVEWIRKNLELEVSASAMTEAMVRDGIDKTIAEAMIETARLLGGESGTSGNSTTRAAKMEWILDSLARSDRARSSEIQTKKSISNEEFYESFYFSNEPLILTGWDEVKAIRDDLSWNALSKRYGEEEVEIQEGRNADQYYERNSNEHKSVVKFREFLDRVLRDDEDNDVYLTANNGKRNDEVFSSITNSNRWMPDILDRENHKGKAFLWIGPKGTVTQLHHDLTNNLLLQVSGSKSVKLFPPCYFTRIYNDFHCYTGFDCDHPDYERFPLVEEINMRECILEEGQALFLPVGWWHQVRSLSPSISITAVNFHHYNRFPDQYTTHWDIS